MTPEDVLASNQNTQRAYQSVFGSPDGKQVLSDLIAYCHGRKSDFDVNDRQHAFNSGKRDVLMRIAEFTNLSLEEIYALRGAGRIRSVSQEEQ